MAFVEDDLTFAERDLTFPEDDLAFVEDDLAFAERDLAFPEDDLAFPEDQLTFPEDRPAFAERARVEARGLHARAELGRRLRESLGNAAEDHAGWSSMRRSGASPGAEVWFQLEVGDLLWIVQLEGSGGFQTPVAETLLQGDSTLAQQQVGLANYSLDRKMRHRARPQPPPCPLLRGRGLGVG